MPAEAGKERADAGAARPRASTLKIPRHRSLERPPERAVPALIDTYSQPKPDDAYFDEAAADRAVEFIESLRQFQGRWAGAPLYLLPWQRQLVREIFGWKRADGLRLIRRVYIEMPRKCGKTTLAAAIAAYLAFEDDEPGAQVVFAACDRDQASYGYSALRFFVEGDPELKARAMFYNSRRHCLITDNPGAKIDVLSSDAAKQFGANLSGIVVDELAMHKSRELWDAITTSTGSREQPLTLAITTPGWDREGPAFQLREHARQISDGGDADPAFLGVVYGTPPDADWTDPESWLAASPSLGVTVQMSYYEEQFVSARAIPAEQNRFRTLLLAQWVGQESRLIDLAAWDRNATAPGPPAKRPAFGGLDLASTTDLAAFVLAIPNDDNTIDVVPHFWTPSENLRERGLRDRAPYEVWEREHLLTATPGAVISYDAIRETIQDAAEIYDLRAVSYDPWNSSHLVQQLESDGITMLTTRQGFASLSAPTKELLRLVLDGKLRHGGNPVLRRMIDVTAAEIDAAGNVKPSKSRSTGRIDGVVALVMAIDGLTRTGLAAPAVSGYDDPANKCARPGCGHLRRHHSAGACRARPPGHCRAWIEPQLVA
jgi:phage terminase large subunit-like protein